MVNGLAMWDNILKLEKHPLPPTDKLVSYFVNLYWKKKYIYSLIHSFLYSFFHPLNLSVWVMNAAGAGDTGCSQAARTSTGRLHVRVWGPDCSMPVLSLLNTRMKSPDSGPRESSISLKGNMVRPVMSTLSSGRGGKRACRVALGKLKEASKGRS